MIVSRKSLLFFFNDTATTEIYTLSLHDALPISNTVNEWRIGVLLKETLDKAPPAFVREHAGYAVGGIPPLGHAKPMETFIDEDLLRHETIWAAAGTPNALFRMPPADLVTMT